LTLENHRLLRRIFEHDLRLAKSGKNNWSRDIKLILTECDLQDYFSLDKGTVNIQQVENVLITKFLEKWHADMMSMSKLQIYSNIKEGFGLETYVRDNTGYKIRSLITSIRAGTLPIELERGRWRGVKRENRICKQCSLGEVEDLHHFLLKCPCYSEEHKDLHPKLGQLTDVADILRLKPKDVAIFALKCFKKPRK